MSSKNEFKIIIIGNSKTGKTSYSKKWSENSFSEDYQPTFFGENKTKEIEIDKKTYKISLFDLPGEDNFPPTFTNMLGKNTNGCIIISDALDINTRDNAKKFRTYLNEVVAPQDGGKIPCILVENKIDLLPEIQPGSKYEYDINKFCEESEIDKSFLVSCKTGKNILESMEYLIKEIIKRMKLNEEKNNKDNLNSININKICFQALENNLTKISLKKDDNEYKIEIDINKIKEKYNILKSVKDREDFIDILSILLKKKKIKVNYFINKLFIQIGVFFTSLTGEEKEITFDLTPQLIDSKQITKYFIEELNKKDEIINSLIKENEKLKKKLNT